MMIPSTDPQVRGGLGLGTRQCARPGTKSAAARLVWVACLQGHSVRERWCFGAPPRWAPRPRPRKPPSLVALCRCFFPFSSGLWRPQTKNPMRPVWGRLCLCSALARLPALQLTHVPKPSAPVGYNYRYRYNSHPERPFMVMFMLGSACCATHLRALSNN